MIEAHPKAFSGAVEKQGQKNRYSTAEYDKDSNRHGLAGSQRDSDNHNQEFAHNQVHGHGPRVVARLAFKNKATHGAAFVGLEDTGEDFSPAAHGAALAQSPSHK